MTNEKRLQALAELQEDGERMEKEAEYDLDKWANSNLSLKECKMTNDSKFNLTEWSKSEAERCCNSKYEHEDAISWMLAGADKALDLVMEWIKESDRNFYECTECSFQMRITTFLSQLRGDYES